MKVLFISLFLALSYYDDIHVTALFNPSDIRNHLSSRTPYRFRSNKNDTRIRYPDCKDSKIWMIIRHGTRLPNSKDITAAQSLIDLRDEILLQHTSGKGQLTKEQLKRLEDWTSDIDVDHGKYLTTEGQFEMIDLADRMQNRFPHAIKQKYSNKTFLFRYTGTQRAQQSARYFTTGLFEKKVAQEIIFPPVKEVDLVLRFYKHCDRWQKQVKKNPETYKESQLYIKSQEMNETLESLSERLGLTRVISFETANTLYKFCGYETSWDAQHKTSAWCAAFDEETILPFEYYHDLKKYWKDGYGYELSYQQACISIKHMFDSFRNDAGPRATFLFTHSGTILKILTYLGLYKPEFPLNSTYRDEDRKWRISDIDTFAANLAIVLYNAIC
ncbi:multiple inositol polyphosphate phosphatase 1-like isoform X2 [Anticarsia gemmatalis]|uniref:multiple inositol polyphosphate phosphatase 1-like isoform X2 n=1 Tax=Anticarsia gemmatalis TaxID=129554 RepID=UPI003F77813D